MCLLSGESSIYMLAFT